MPRLDITEETPIKIGVGVKNFNKLKHIQGEGEVVVKFSNYSKAPKFFIASVIETDETGKPLADTGDESTGKQLGDTPADSSASKKSGSKKPGKEEDQQTDQSPS